MTIERGDAQQGRALAQRSAQRRRVLTLTDVEAELPELSSAANIVLACQTIQRWGLAGLAPGVVVGAAIRACEVALKGLDSELFAKRLRLLERRLDGLEAERRERDDWKKP